MKAKEKKLGLDKKIIRKLTDQQLSKIVGGNEPPTLQGPPPPGKGTNQH